ncbi:MAG: hypothetical protein K8R02_02200 [Anaerohalosphaeraceae bacterium]|nr:hypothetical protein [Anaerohalosphaeraceae bacterium]
MTDIAPMVLSAVICDRVLFDAPTKTSSLISIRDTIVSPKYPIRYPQIFFFAELTNGHGQTELTVKLIDTNEDDKVLLDKKNTVKFPDVKSIVSVVLGFEGLTFAHPGEYCFQLYSGGQLLISRRLICLQLQRRSKNDANEH